MDAQAHCEVLGGDLASIADADQQAFLIGES